MWAPESILQIMNFTEVREGLLFHKRGHTNKTSAHLSEANINAAAATQSSAQWPFQPRKLFCSW